MVSKMKIDLMKYLLIENVVFKMVSKNRTLREREGRKKRKKRHKKNIKEKEEGKREKEKKNKKRKKNNILFREIHN